MPGAFCRVHLPAQQKNRGSLAQVVQRSLVESPSTGSGGGGSPPVSISKHTQAKLVPARRQFFESSIPTTFQPLFECSATGNSSVAISRYVRHFHCIRRSIVTRSLLGLLAAFSILQSTACAGKAPSNRVRTLLIVCDAQLPAKGRLDTAETCETVRSAVSASLHRPVKLVGFVPPSGDLLRVTVRMARLNAIEMSVRGRLDGRRVSKGPLTLDVMDRALVRNDVSQLTARLVHNLVGAN